MCCLYMSRLHLRLEYVSVFVPYLVITVHILMLLLSHKIVVNISLVIRLEKIEMSRPIEICIFLNFS